MVRGARGGGENSEGVGGYESCEGCRKGLAL